ncbi:hypothetical protein [Archangium lipolyticum]|uniref:hypothetical protein n=1 Tax=Archangium lipolyticum TaxID=2970465 RepID=UPI00214A2204|nr:hypothetical protein [Archangium lipolyticum]
MTRKLVGLFASVALVSSGLAVAGDQERGKDPQTQSSQPAGGDAIGGAGTQGQTGGSQHGQAGSTQGQMGGAQGQMGGAQQMGEKQVSGTVVKSGANQLSLLTDNGVIAIKINKNTKFQDPGVKGAKDLKEGQQVRTSFTVEKDSNVAKSISLDTSMGGSGMSPDQGINQQPGDTGGSGLDQGMDKDHNLGGDVGGSGDVGGTSGDVGGAGDTGK